MVDVWLQFVLTMDGTLRLAVPLIFCVMAGIFSERSGIIDIALGGKILLGTFAAAGRAIRWWLGWRSICWHRA